MNIILILIILYNCNALEEKNEERYPRFSSFKGYINENPFFSLKCKSPFTDTYLVTYSSDIIQSFRIMKSNGEIIQSNILKDKKTLEIKLTEDEVIIIKITATKPNSILEYTVEALNHHSLFPYDPINFKNSNKKDLYGNKNEDPLKEAVIESIKRPGGLYINDNNPERLTEFDLKKGLVRNDISNKEVFFTFEHENIIKDSFYYGYQVINKGKENAYITVKNIGFHLDGHGSWKGEKEWIQFYNQKFRLLYKDKWNESQQKHFKASFDFCDCYEPNYFQPITYLLPPGKYFYVMGGTTKDAYLNISVDNTADNMVKGGCSNGAVLFDVIGDNIEGVHYVYQDPSEVTLNNTSHQGYVISKPNDERNYGRQYNGYDDCKGVIDTHAEWTFNDNTKSQSLPVTYDNYYVDGISIMGTPYEELKSVKHTQKGTVWYTHINPQKINLGIGTDIAKYTTINSDKQKIVIDPEHRDGCGYIANVGNWMIDYFDSLRFINQGDKDRKITIRLKNFTFGGVAAMVRDEDGNVIEGTQQYTVILDASEYGDAIYDYFVYDVTIKPHSYLVLHVEYNLFAGSYGKIEHEVILE